MTTLTTLKITLKKGKESFEEAMGGLLTFAQYQVLDAVRRSDQTPDQTQLVLATGIDRSTLSDVVRRLVNKRLLIRKRNKEDARAWELSVTEEGFDLLKQADKQLRPIERSLTLAEAAE